jgi:hypothetical protein
MRDRWVRQATECPNGSTDWTTLGARILQVATVAAATHLVERTRVSPQAATVASLLDSGPGQPELAEE